MSKVCEIVNEATLECLKWVDFSLLPVLTVADRDHLLKWAIGIFATVFVVKMIRRLFGV